MEFGQFNHNFNPDIQQFCKKLKELKKVDRKTLLVEFD